MRIFSQMEQYNSRALSICMDKTVVPLGNQMERFFPLVTGNFDEVNCVFHQGAWYVLTVMRQMVQ